MMLTIDHGQSCIQDENSLHRVPNVGHVDLTLTYFV